MSALKDQTIHMWSKVIASPEHIPNQHGTCGVHIGRFTQQPSDVTCRDCQTIIYGKLLNVNAVTVISRNDDWKAHVTGDETQWEAGSTAISAVFELLKSRPYLLERIR
jgi:hypothetical protein